MDGAQFHLSHLISHIFISQIVIPHRFNLGFGGGRLKASGLNFAV